MKTNTIKLLSILFLSLLTFSCGKDDDETSPEPTTEELLTETGRWYIESITNEIMDDCYKTSYWEFSGENFNEQWFSTDTENNCVAGFSDSNAYEWISDTQFNVLDENYPAEVTIESITETELTVNWYSITNDENSVMVLDKNPGNE